MNYSHVNGRMAEDRQTDPPTNIIRTDHITGSSRDWGGGRTDMRNQCICKVLFFKLYMVDTKVFFKNLHFCMPEVFINLKNI